VPIIDHRSPPLVLIAGPTGVGKSALAVDLAAELGGEIISADSRQVYRGLAIGTAAPTPEERARVPHHLVQFLAPDEPFSAAMFVDAAERALAEIDGRGRSAFLVGGSHHYLQALFEGLELPRVAPDPEWRAELEREAAEVGPEAIHRRLAALDPVSGAAIPAANLRRVIRALEVIRATGRPFSDIGRRRGAARPGLRLALTMPREQLYMRIDARIDAMLRGGWLDEVQALLETGYSPNLPALTSTGYRELIRHLRGEIELDEAAQLVKYSTHAFVRRQYAWLRRFPGLEWFEQGPDLLERARRRVAEYLTDGRVRRPAGGSDPQLAREDPG
jgi:tRNA dimethylallyltransferase